MMKITINGKLNKVQSEEDISFMTKSTINDQIKKVSFSENLKASIWHKE